MRAGMLLALVAVVVGLSLAGCGGGSEQVAPPPERSSIQGQVDIQGSTADYELLLDGQPVPGALRVDGSYLIENVPPGQHRVAVVARNGMHGGYTTVDVPEGRRVRAPVIVPELGGQIVGIVTVYEDGALRPLEGVEVTAQPAVMIMGDRPVEPREAPNGRPEIYPPPDGVVEFSAFTDANGSFIIRAVPQGEYTVSVAQPGMENSWQWVWVEAGHTAVADFTLRPAIEPGVGTVRGRVAIVQDGVSAPALGARVTIVSDTWWGPIWPPEIPDRPVPLDEGGDRGQSEPGMPAPPDPGLIAPPYYDSVSTLTNAAGEYTLNAPSGYASIEVYMPGWMPVWEQIQILPGQTLTRSFRLEELEDWIDPPSAPPFE